MNVCVIGTRGFPQIEGGVEKHCESLYPFMRDDVHIIVFRRRSYVTSDVKYKNIRFIDLPSTQKKGIEAIIHSLLATFCSIAIHPDIVHFHNIGPAVFSPFIKLFGMKVVLTYHSANYEHKKWGKFAKKLLLAAERIALKYSDRIIFVSCFQMGKYSENIKQKSIYIPNGIRKPLFSANTNFLEEIGVLSGKYILSVGRITPEKGFDTLIKSYNKANTGDYKLVIAGGVEFESAYRQQLDALASSKNVIFTGYVYGDKLAQLYTNAAIFVLTSEQEGFPLVLLESLSYGLDVLVSDIPATHLVSLENDDYFPVKNSVVLSQKIEERLNKAEIYNAKTGHPFRRRYDLKRFDWNAIISQVESIYDDVLNYNDALEKQRTDR